MMRNALLVRGAAALALVGAAVACNNDKKDVITAPVPSGGAMFQSYVSLGNSITAGYQSGGINDSTQRQGYAYLLAQSMGTRFVYPSLQMPGCPPPIRNFQTGQRVGPDTASSTTCFFRAPSSISPIINNVAVPGATSLDPTSSATAASNLLTSLFLGGKTQVEKALEARPTFATVWVGNNDVLVPTLTGLLVPVKGVSPGVTPVPTFIRNYAAMIDQLTAGAPGLKGVLIGVVDVDNAPAMFKVSELINNPTFKAQFDVAATGTVGGVTIDSTCVNRPTSLIYTGIIQAIAAKQHPPVLVCKPNSTNLVGNIYVVDPTEESTETSTVNAYNAYIQAKADSIGFAYFDPNAALLQLRMAGAIPPHPDLTSATAPFGTYMSLDGLHPALPAHKAIANALIATIKDKYGVQLPTVQ